MINYTSQRLTKVLGLIALTGLTTLLSAQTMNWKPAGPIYSAGRARNIVVDKNDNQVLYTGSASSGIFKTKDGGINWYSLNDQATIRNVSYLAQSVDGTIFAGTGEGFLRAGQKAKAQAGTGLYKLNPADSSLTLVVSSSVVGTEINRVACSPANANYIALATNLGVFVSSNAGAAFTQVTLPQAPTGSGVSGLDVKFDVNGTLYCSFGVFASNTSSLSSTKVYKSLDATATTFTNITPSSNIIDANYGRIELAIAPSNSNIIYASCANVYTGDNTSTLKGVFVSYDAGSNWVLILQGSSQSDPLSNGGTVSSGDYAHVITVNPTDPNIVYLGGYSFYMYFRTGGTNANPIGTWVPIGQPFVTNSQYYLHENIHDIKVVPGTPTKHYFVTDAGVFRSIDLLSLNQQTPPSFQPFYRGMVTGQFNSVSIERFPLSDSLPTNRSGMKVTPYSGFVGGTGGNGLIYFSGTNSVVVKELSYISGEIYNTEYSKILPNAVFASRGNGVVYRSTNIKTSQPAVVNTNKYSGNLSVIAPTTEGFSNLISTTSGTPFRLWEYYGQPHPSISDSTLAPPDSAVFYNDSVRYQSSMTGIPVNGVRELTTKTTFTFSTSRPNQYALIDSIVVRTGTVQLPITGTYANLQTPFVGADRQTIYARTANKTYTAYNSPATLSCLTVGASTIPVTFTLNPTTLVDNITVTFTAPPFATKTITQYPESATPSAAIVPDAAVYYRVFATVYYKYQANSVVSEVDNNISTRTNTYTSSLSQPISWRYGSFPSSTIASTSTLAVTNPTYVLINNSTIHGTDTVKQSTPTFVVKPYATTSYTIYQFGNYTLNATPISYSIAGDPITETLTATINGTLTSPVYTLTPGSYTQTSNVFVVAPTSSAGNTYTIQSGSTISTFTSAPTSFSISPSVGTQTTSNENVFVLSTNPTVSTTYTVTQTTGTLTQMTYSTIGSSTYILNPGNVVKVDSTSFNVNISNLDSYTITSLSSNTLAGKDTSKVYHSTGTSPDLDITTTTTVNFGSVPLNPNNPTEKMPVFISARLAMIMNNAGITGGADAIVVSKNPLALNDPMSFVRVSQTGAYSDDATGNPTTNSITIVGKPTLLEWSKSGTEIYFATNSNKLYRVSHITTIMDLSPSSYSGKFFTDIFKYNVSPLTPNPASPYRTTLIGSFDKTITSISVSNDGKNLAVTFNGASTGTTGTIMYNTNDASKSNETNIAWTNKQGSLANTITYCSMMEKTNDKIVFVGTDNGMFYTTDITSGSWSSVNTGADVTSQLPKVQIFDIKQQTLDQWNCYNSGQIYVATNGRGVWTTGTYFRPYTVGIEETEKPIEGKNLSVFPNPTNGNVNVTFSGVEGETATLQVMDISGRIVLSEKLGKLNTGDVNYNFDTRALNSGVYIVNIQSNSNVKRVTKLIVTK